MPTPSKSHDLHLPSWGPYTKRYTGISHIPDPSAGLRFDLAIIPGYYRRQVLVPNAKWESGHHAWEAAPDLSYYAFRYELEWKDQVYCDVSFSALGEDARLVRCEFVNNTEVDQNMVLHWAAYMNFPPVRPYSDEAIQQLTVLLPDGAVWVDALDYTDLRFATSRPTDNLVYDAMLRGEIRRHGLVNGCGIGLGFGRESGDTVQFQLRLDHPMQNARLVLRYRLPTDGDRGPVNSYAGEATVKRCEEGARSPARFLVDGAFQGEVSLPGHDEFSLLSLLIGELSAGPHNLTFTSLGGAAVELDGFALLESEQEHQLAFVPHIWTHAPVISAGPRPQSVILQYVDTIIQYGIAWNCADYQVREIITDELDRYLRHMVHEHVKTTLQGPGEGHFTNIFLRPIPVPPHSTREVYGLVCSGTREAVTGTLEAFSTDDSRLEALYQQSRAKAFRPAGSESGQAYAFSQKRMAATTLLNVVYPVYTRRSFIRHNTPGKWWDCLYTWDSGFIALGLLELDLQRAIDCLDAYLTDPGDAQCAFVHHGSFVPVQMYVFHELWNRTQDRQLLEYFYPRLRQYYHFLAGRLGSSTTRSLRSNLLKTWDYFYNSGGWDDYPPQVYVHQQRLERTVAPVVTTAHAIRSAKILQMAAQALGASEDLPLYAEDIHTFTEALQRHAWDEVAGYFSYVVHDEQGSPREFLRHESGTNFNMGMDGASPLYAGACTPDQEERLLGHLFSPLRMWTAIGLSTVDQSAPYYKKDGYWNGAVWFPHQWFFWKGLFDLGTGERAHQIADTALRLWKNEVENSYYCFEHFIVQSGRGAGWHQFGGLSTPVLSWFNAYHQPGRLTTGLDAWVERVTFSDHNRALHAHLRLAPHAGHAPTLLATLTPGPRYHATWNSQPVSLREPLPGAVEVRLPEEFVEGVLEISHSDD